MRFHGKILQLVIVRSCLDRAICDSPIRFFIDDTWEKGPAEAPGKLVADVGLTDGDVAGIRAGWQHAIASAQQSIVQAGAYSWQLMSNSWTAAGPPFGPKPQDCTAYMRKACTPDSNISRSMLFYGLESFPRPPEVKGGALPNLMRDLAAFLLVGGPWHFFAQSVR